MALSWVNLIAQDILDLKIPEFQVSNATMEEALRELHAWGIQVCLEKAPRQNGEEEGKISVNLRDASVREVLNALVSEDKRYAWERYRRMSVSLTNLINVFPVGAKEDPSNLMNIKAKKVVVKAYTTPENLIQSISEFVPELVRKLYVGRGGIAGSIPGGPIGPIELYIDFKFEGMTVRDILNEIALRTAGHGWVYEPEPTPRWDVLW